MHMEHENILEVRDLRKTYHHTSVLSGVNFNVKAGEVKAVLGSSGSGKSTMLKLMALLETPDSGQILLRGNRIGVKPGTERPAPERTLAHQRTDIGMVFQKFNLFPHMNALDNVMVGLTSVRHMPKKEATAKAEEMLREVGLQERMKHFPSELSGGQQQRVAIARALAMDPAVMLFDEPTSALDPELVGEVLRVIERLAAEGMTMVVVTHEMGFARRAASSVTFMSGGEIVEEAPPAQFFTSPGHQSTIRFLEHVQAAAPA